MSAGINFSGLASGIDTNAIIDAMLATAQLPITRLETRKTNYKTQSSLLSSLASKLSSLKTAAKSMDTDSEFQSYVGSSSDEDKILATAGSSATPGSYSITVSSLTQAERTYSAGFAAEDQTGLVGTGTLTIQVGTSAAVNVAVDDTTDTLETVAAGINNSGAAVKASVVYSGTQYRLVVNGTDLGADNYITFTDPTNLDLDVVGNQAQAAADATIVMDGITFTDSSNTMTDVIPNVTLELKDQTAVGTPVTVTVQVDTDTIETNIDDMVKDYNAIIGFLNAQFSYSADTNSTATTLMGDASARGIKSRLQGIAYGEVSALSGPYNALARIGITSDSAGTLVVDSTKLKAALADDLDAVTQLFTYTDGVETTDNDGVAVRMERALVGMLQDPDGILPTRQEGISDKIDDIDGQIDRLERNMESYEASLLQKFTALEQVLSQLNSQGNFLSAGF